MNFAASKGSMLRPEKYVLGDLPKQLDLPHEIGQARAARAVLEVELTAIRHNVEIIRRISYGAKVMAVVKGNAYGLGARVIGRMLQSWGVPAFAVDNVAEGIKLRAGGIHAPILVIDGDLPDKAFLAIAYNLTPGIAQENLLLAYEQAAAQHGKKHPIWLVANVGFNRSGYRNLEKFTSFALRAFECRHLEVRAVYAHLTNSNGNAKISLAQIDEFREVASRAKEIFGPELETSLFASHGLVRWAKAFPTDWVRPGVLLYGEHAFDKDRIKPETAEAIQQFRPAIRLRSRIIHLLDILSEIFGEEKTGSDQRLKMRPRPRLATVSIGFGSGYPSGAKKLHPLVRGRRVSLFGDVGMDNLLLDVTDLPEVELYDWVTLIGT